MPLRRMPGEFEPHERTLICWPTRRELYRGVLMDEAREAHAVLAQSIARFEPVTMIAAPGDGERASAMCGSTVDVVEIPIDDSWVRDSGPIYVRDEGGGRVALDWVFNAWGEKFHPYDADAALARRWAEHAEHVHQPVEMVLEGGSISVDGAGGLVTTTQCLLHPNRNPTMTQREIERTLCSELGVDTIVWLPYGLALDEDTDGHVDNVAAFARPGVLVLQGCDDRAEADWVRMDVNRRIAADHCETVVVPVLPFVERDGHARVAVPYLNYYVGNGFVVVPVCGHPADDEMVSIIADTYPGRTTIALDVGTILALGGGGIHCITQQLPAV